MRACFTCVATSRGVYRQHHTAGITVIHPGADDAAGNHVGYLTCEVTSNVTQCTDVKNARAHHAVRMGLEGQLIVQRDAEGFQFFAHIDAASGYTDERRRCRVTQFLPGAKETQLRLVGVEK